MRTVERKREEISALSPLLRSFDVIWMSMALKPKLLSTYLNPYPLCHTPADHSNACRQTDTPSPFCPCWMARRTVSDKVTKSLFRAQIHHETLDHGLVRGENVFFLFDNQRSLYPVVLTVVKKCYGLLWSSTLVSSFTLSSVFPGAIFGQPSSWLINWNPLAPIVSSPFVFTSAWFLC